LLACGTSSNCASRLDDDRVAAEPPGVFLTREQLLEHGAEHATAFDPSFPMLANPRSLFSCSRRLRRHQAVARDRDQIGDLLAENKYLKEKVCLLEATGAPEIVVHATSNFFATSNLVLGGNFA